MHGQDLELHNGGDASRDFIFVEDICRGLMACALRGKSGDVYNLASGRETTIKEWAELIMKMTGGKAKVQLLPKRDWDTSGKRFGSTQKALKELGFQAKTDSREGLEMTIAWTESNMGFIDRCMAKHNKYMSVGHS
jgi:nucleoside-diphosphate-sugar epimerase